MAIYDYPFLTTPLTLTILNVMEYMYTVQYNDAKIG